jgi:hypothetical protein
MVRIFALLIILSLASCQPKSEPERPNWATEVQSLITESIVIEDEPKVRKAIPYESITIERGPCFGECPVYKMTLNRDGTALLTTDHLLPDAALNYSAKISLYDYAHIALVVEMVRSTSPQSEYRGGWTDDSGVTITAKSSTGTWQVYDGRVGPPAVWALEQILDGTRNRLQWAGGVK